MPHGNGGAARATVVRGVEEEAQCLAHFTRIKRPIQAQLLADLAHGHGSQVNTSCEHKHVCQTGTETTIVEERRGAVGRISRSAVAEIEEQRTDRQLIALGLADPKSKISLLIDLRTHVVHVVDVGGQAVACRLAIVAIAHQAVPRTILESSGHRDRAAATATVVAAAMIMGRWVGQGAPGKCHRCPDEGQDYTSR